METPVLGHLRPRTQRVRTIHHPGFVPMRGEDCVRRCSLLHARVERRNRPTDEQIGAWAATTMCRAGREKKAHERLRVPKILTTSFPEILATCR